MFKKILSFILICMTLVALVGCSDSSNNEAQETEATKEKIILEKEEIEMIKTDITDSILASAYEGAIIKVESKQEKILASTDNVLEISVIKSINDIASTYNTLSSDDTVKAIRKSLTFDTAIEIASEKIDKIKEFDKIKVSIYNSEEEFEKSEYWTYKNINMK